MLYYHKDLKAVHYRKLDPKYYSKGRKEQKYKWNFPVTPALPEGSSQMEGKLDSLDKHTWVLIQVWPEV